MIDDFNRLVRWKSGKMNSRIQMVNLSGEREHLHMHSVKGTQGAGTQLLSSLETSQGG